MRRLALIYSDGTNTVLQDGTTLMEAFKERDHVDMGEANPDNLTKVAWVNFELEALVDSLSPAPSAIA